MSNPNTPAGLGTIQITITMRPDGQVGVSGPLENKLVCYGLLDIARDCIRDHKPGKTVIEPPPEANGLKLRM